MSRSTPKSPPRFASATCAQHARSSSKCGATLSAIGAFVGGSSDLHAILQARGVDTLIVTGTASQVCCESTARDAMMLNYKVFFVTDGNATFTDAEHNATLSAMAHTFCDVIGSDAEKVQCGAVGADEAGVEPLVNIGNRRFVEGVTQLGLQVGVDPFEVATRRLDPSERFGGCDGGCGAVGHGAEPRAIVGAGASAGDDGEHPQSLPLEGEDRRDERTGALANQTPLVERGDPARELAGWKAAELIVQRGTITHVGNQEKRGPSVGPVPDPDT